MAPSAISTFGFRAGPWAWAASSTRFASTIRSTSESENNVLIEGNLLKGVGTTDSPYDKFDAVHSQFGIDWQNHPFIERFVFDGRLVDESRVSELDALNHWPDSGAMVLYTTVYGDSTPSDSTRRHPLAVTLRSVGQRGDTLLFRVNGSPRQGWRLPLSQGGALVAGGTRRSELRALAASGGLVRIVPRLAPDRGRLRTVIGGWPRLIVHGRSIAAQSDSLEGTTRGFSNTRHPRTAVGISPDSTKLFLITVDGRSESDSGMSLVELADAMLQLGVYEGMNFDGGGSTTMVIDGKVVNSPSDRNGERAIGSGLVIIVDEASLPPS